MTINSCVHNANICTMNRKEKRRNCQKNHVYIKEKELRHRMTMIINISKVHFP